MKSGSTTLWATATLATLAVLSAGGLVGCQSTTNSPGNPNPTNFKYGRGDGQTMSSAVEIRTRSEMDGGVMIRNWIKSNYPGFTIQEQQLIEQRDKAYNMITLINQDNSSKRVYFDISAFYRRLGNERFPKPMS
jgi:hypothetical protein